MLNKDICNVCGHSNCINIGRFQFIMTALPITNIGVIIFDFKMECINKTGSFIDTEIEYVVNDIDENLLMK